MSQSRVDEAKAKAQAAYARCDELRRAGHYATHLAAVDCAVPTVVAAYGEAAYPFNDLIYISIQARRVGAAKVDAGEVTDAQYRRDLVVLDTRLAAEDRRRRAIMEYGGNPQPAAVGTLLQGLSAFTTTSETAARPAPGPAAEPGCVPLGAIRTCR
ncbi:MAG TPA: hypothetical protein VMU87_16035 [Stellaceae bacterium]|nr:hypothetical protein [Stellaceae bacterium]